MTVRGDTRVGQIAAEYPLATRVFARHGIDFCCKGGRRIQEVCDEKGLDVATFIDEISEAVAQTDVDLERWNEASPADLIEHIVTTYHRHLDEELPRLEFMARKVARVHGNKAPDVLPALLETFLELKAELTDHMAKEEQILFPMILKGKGALAGAPIAILEHDHDRAGSALGRLRELTNDYEVPLDACNTWRALWHGLASLEEDLHQHIHLENNILFPQALATTH